MQTYIPHHLYSCLLSISARTCILHHMLFMSLTKLFMNTHFLKRITPHFLKRITPLYM